MKYLKQILLSLVFVFTSCLLDEESKPDTELENNEYTSNIYGYSIQFPSEWKVQENAQILETTFDVFAKTNISYNGFYANILIESKITSGIEDVQALIAEIRETLTGFEIEGDRVYQVENTDVIEITVFQAQNGVRIKQQLLFFSNNGRDIGISFTDLENRYDSNEEFQNVRSSLKIF